VAGWFCWYICGVQPPKTPATSLSWGSGPHQQHVNCRRCTWHDDWVSIAFNPPAKLRKQGHTCRHNPTSHDKTAKSWLQQPARRNRLMLFTLSPNERHERCPYSRLPPNNSPVAPSGAHPLDTCNTAVPAPSQARHSQEREPQELTLARAGFMQALAMLQRCSSESTTQNVSSPSLSPSHQRLQPADRLNALPLQQDSLLVADPQHPNSQPTACARLQHAERWLGHLGQSMHTNEDKELQEAAAINLKQHLSALNTKLAPGPRLLSTCS